MATFANEAPITTQIHTQNVAGSSITLNIYGSSTNEHAIPKDVVDNDDCKGFERTQALDTRHRASPPNFTSSTDPAEDGWQSSVKSVCLIPHDRNLAFINRSAEMDRLHTALDPSNTTKTTTSLPLLAILHGLGGIGKTSLATEFAYQYHDQYPLCSVLWVHANSAESIHKSLSKIAVELDLDVAEDDQPSLAREVAEWLTNKAEPSWLMVIDNADDVDTLFNYHKHLMNTLLRCPGGSWLVTTRTTKVAMKVAARLRKDNATISVTPMSEGEALSLIKSCSTFGTNPLCSGRDFDSAAAKTIAELVGHLPLALVQAGTYAHENFIPLDKYVQMWRESTKNAQDLLEFEFDAEGRNSEDMEVPNAVAASLILTLDLLAQKHPFASNLLSKMTLLHYTAIPEGLLLDDEISTNTVSLVSELTALSLISRSSSTEDIEVHRLVHIVAYRWQHRKDSSDEIEARTTQLLARLNRMLPRHPSKQDRSKLDLYLPHAISCISRGSLGNQPYSRDKVLLQRKTAEHLLYQGRTFHAARLRTTILQQMQNTDEQKPKEILRAKYDLAAVLKRLRRFKEAEDLCKDIIHTCGKAGQAGYGGMTHINTASLLCDLLTERRLYSEADVMIQVTQSATPTARSDDEEVSIRLDFQAARVKRQEALDLPPSNLKMRIKLLTEAKSILLLAGARADASYGARGNLSLIGTQHLAGVLNDLGELVQAETMYELIIKIKAENLGANHVETFMATRNLLSFYLNRGLLEKAALVIDKLLHQQRLALDEKHPECLKTRRCLARLYEHQGTVQAIQIQQQRQDIELSRSIIDLDSIAAEKAKIKLVMLQSEMSALQAELESEVNAMWDMQLQKVGLERRANQMWLSRDSAREHDLKQQGARGERIEKTKIIRAVRGKLLSTEGRLPKVQDALRSKEKKLEEMKHELQAQEEMLGKLLKPAISSMRNAISEQERITLAMLEVLGPEQPETLDLMSECAKTIQKALLLDRATFAKHIDTARSLLEEVVLRQTGLHEDDTHQDVLSSKALLAAHLHDQGNYQEVEVLERSVLSGEKQRHGNDHVRTLVAMHALAETYAAQGTPESRLEAILLMERCCAISLYVLGEGHPDTKTRFELLDQCKSENQMYDDAASASRSSRILKDADNMLTEQNLTIHDTSKFSLSVASKGGSRHRFWSSFVPSSVSGPRTVVPSALNVVRGFSIGQLIGEKRDSILRPG